MSDDRYEWISTGGCERCDDMEERTYAEEPERPHPHCTCEIVDHHDDNAPCREDRYSYTVAHSGNDHPPAPVDPDDSFEMAFDYRIQCPAGEVLDGSVTIERTYHQLDSQDIDDFFLDAYAEAYEEVDDIAATDCPPCPQPPIVA